jgi:hypothetical protein
MVPVGSYVDLSDIHHLEIRSYFEIDVDTQACTLLVCQQIIINLRCTSLLSLLRTPLRNCLSVQSL